MRMNVENDCFYPAVSADTCPERGARRCLSAPHGGVWRQPLQTAGSELPAQVLVVRFARYSVPINVTIDFLFLVEAIWQP